MNREKYIKMLDAQIDVLNEASKKQGKRLQEAKKEKVQEELIIFKALTDTQRTLMGNVVGLSEVKDKK